MEEKNTDIRKNRMDYNNEYNRNNYRSFSVRFNKKSEREIIHWLESQNSVKEYLTDLILQDMRKGNTR